jgi:hypothetical protein
MTENTETTPQANSQVADKNQNLSWAANFANKVKSFFGIGNISLKQGETELTDEDVDKTFQSKEWQSLANEIANEINSNNQVSEAQSEAENQNSETEMTKEEIAALIAEATAKTNAEMAQRLSGLQASLETLQSQNEQLAAEKKALETQKGLDKKAVLDQANNVKLFAPKNADKGNSNLENQEPEKMGKIKLGAIEFDADVADGVVNQKARFHQQAMQAFEKNQKIGQQTRKERPQVKIEKA